MLKTQKVWLPFLAMAAIGIYLGLSDKKTIYKTSFVLLAVTAALIVIIACFSVQFMSAKYLLPHKAPTLSSFSGFLPLYFSLSTALLPVVLSAKNKRAFFSPLLVFSLLFAVCIFNVLGMFGSEFASVLNYPYAVAVSTAATGDIFSRLDGFFYMICFFAALIKIGATVYAIKEIVTKFICRTKPKKI